MRFTSGSPIREINDILLAMQICWQNELLHVNTCCPFAGGIVRLHYHSLLGCIYCCVVVQYGDCTGRMEQSTSCMLLDVLMVSIGVAAA